METESRRILDMQLGVAYSRNKFNKLDGQRPIDESNVKNLMDSIVNDGGIIQPVIIDGELNVIDGGHRVEAISRLNEQGYNFPIYYVINHSAGSYSMKESNIVRKDWNLNNFLEFEAKQGDTVCLRVLQLQKEYNDFAPGVVANIMNDVLGRTAIKSLRDGNYNIEEQVGRRVLDVCRAVGRSGHLIAEEKRAYALARFTNAIKKIILLNEHFDADHLLSKITRIPLGIYSTTEDIMRKVQQAYNDSERRIENKIAI